MKSLSSSLSIAIFFLGNLLFSQNIEHKHNLGSIHHWQIPSKDPDRIILTFNGDPATKRAVTWRTEKSILNAYAQISEATKNSKFSDSTITIKAKTESLDISLYRGKSAIKINYHNVTFKNLKPNTKYVYRVGDGDSYWSEWIQFKTAKQTYAPTQFIFLGDAQNDVLSHWTRLYRKAYQTAPNANFIIHAGDLINNAHKDNEWAEWHKAGDLINKQLTSIPVVGNHEVKPLKKGEQKQLSIYWKPQFTLPVNHQLDKNLHETVYSINYQDVKIIVLNSNYNLEEQTKYLEDQLKNCDAKWKIVTCHHSIFSPAKGRDFAYGRKVWKPLLDKYNVDLVLNGHDHTYARGHVPFNKIGNSKKRQAGTIYVTSVSGPKHYNLDVNQIKTYSNQGYKLDVSGEQTQFFQIIDINDNKLTYKAYDVIGNLYDIVSLKKNFKNGKKRLIN